MLGSNRLHFNKGFSLADLEKGAEFEVEHDRTLSDDSDDNESFYDEHFEDFKKKMHGIGIKPRDLLMPFTELKTFMEPLLEDGGVMKQVLKMGTGITIPEKAIVMMQYDAFWENEREPFDSTRMRNKPFKFLLGDGGVILGLDIAIKTMKKDEISKILVTPNYAYGEMGCEPRIRKNAHVLFIVEILNFIDSKEAIEFEEMDAEDQRRAPFEKIVAVFHCEHQMANDLFRNKNYKPAIARYRKMVRLLENVSVATEEEDTRRKDYLLKLYLNLSACYANVHNSTKAIIYANLALQTDENNVKVLYRMGYAYFIADELDKAEYYLSRAKQKRPFDVSICKVFTELEKKRKQHKQWENMFYKRMFLCENKESKSAREFPSMKELKSTLEDEFKKFIESENKELRLSPGHTSEEIEVIEELARAHKLLFIKKIQDDTKVLKVVKHETAS